MGKSEGTRDTSATPHKPGHGGKNDENRIANPPLKDEHQRYSKHSGQDDVDAQAEDSFPASDPPSYGGTTSGRPKTEKADKKPQSKH
jgi:hypothetical protein